MDKKQNDSGNSTNTNNILDYSASIGKSFDAIFGSNFNKELTMGKCPFCRKKALEKVFFKNVKHPQWYNSEEMESVIQCQNCGWWEHIYTFVSDNPWEDPECDANCYSEEGDFAILRSYRINEIEAPITILNDYIRNNQDVVAQMSSEQMAEIIKRTFSDYYSCEVHLVGKTKKEKDDLFLIDGETQKFLQVTKKLDANTFIPVKGISALLGITFSENKKPCIYVIDQDTFDLSDIEKARKSDADTLVTKYNLTDAHGFVEMMKLQKDTLPDQWESLIKIKDDKGHFFRGN